MDRVTKLERRIAAHPTVTLESMAMQAELNAILDARRDLGRVNAIGKQVGGLLTAYRYDDRSAYMQAVDELQAEEQTILAKYGTYPTLVETAR